VERRPLQQPFGRTTTVHSHWPLPHPRKPPSRWLVPALVVG
jgi:hypothetical protein